MDSPLGVKYLAVVREIAALGARGKTVWTNPFPQDRSPIIKPRSLSRTAPLTISEALALPRSMRIIKGIFSYWPFRKARNSRL